MTPTTTWEAIRVAQSSLVRGVAPTAHPRDKFREHDHEHVFDDWALAHPSACFRRYEIVFSANYEPPPVWTNQVRQELGGALVRVAYPHQFAKYGKNSESDMRALIDDDRRRITDTLENLANYPLGCHRQAVDDWSALSLGDVTILELDVGLIYYRSNAA